jgi:hypothetical protein
VGSNRLGQLPFFLVTGAIAAASLGVVALGVFLRWGVWSFALLIVPGVFAAVYLMQYSKLPYAAPAPPAPVAAEETEPFDDPVEEADRRSAEGAVSTDESPTAAAETGPTSDAREPVPKAE